ncbi:hypothetical protein ACVWZA_003524 [Sphingomonas sp. UYAg733]
MDRPASIVNFERAYLAAFAIGVVNTILSWSTTKELIASQEAIIGTWILPLSTAISFGITLLLWYFVARQGSVVAKWIATVLIGLAVFFLVISVLRGAFELNLRGIFQLVSTALQAFAISLLFRPDTKVWFGETGPSRT